MTPKYSRHDVLDSAFAALREEYTEGPPPQLQEPLRRRLGAIRRTRRIRVWSVVTAVAAGLLIGAVFVMSSRQRVNRPLRLLARVEPHVANPGRVTPVAVPRHQTMQVARRVTRNRRPYAAGVDSVYAGGFLAIPYAEPLSPAEQVDVYRVALPRATVARFGLPTDGIVDSPVVADLAVGSDGVARAVRFIR
jgi:hypothetical protein